MTVLLWLIPLSIVISIFWVLVYLRIAHTGHFDELQRASEDILVESLDLTSSTTSERDRT